MKIGERLRKLRLSKDMTLEEVGKLLNISRQTLQRYETGVIGNIPSDKIELLSEIYNSTPAYIMGWEEKSKENIYSINSHSSSYIKDEPAYLVAAHALEDLTEEEQKQVLDYANFLRSKRKKENE